MSTNKLWIYELRPAATYGLFIFQDYTRAVLLNVLTFCLFIHIMSHTNSVNYDFSMFVKIHSVRQAIEIANNFF